MSHYLSFLPLEIQTSIAELRTFGVPDSALDLLEMRIFKAGEAKTTSLQMDIVRIEDSINLRLERIGEKLRADLQTQHGETNAMIVEIRSAQQIAHPQIGHLQTTLEGYRAWGDRLRLAFEEGRDFAASERARLKEQIDAIDGRVTVIEEILELVPKPQADS